MPGSHSCCYIFIFEDNIASKMMEDTGVGWGVGRSTSSSFGSAPTVPLGVVHVYFYLYVPSQSPVEQDDHASAITGLTAFDDVILMGCIHIMFVFL